MIGQKVFLDYDQEALDRAYDQNIYAPNRAQIDERNNMNADAVRGRIGQPERIAYGTGPAEHLDAYRTKVPNAPLFFFVRGGAWRRTPIERYAFAAELFVRSGVHYVTPQYPGVDVDTDGRLLPLAEALRNAFVWVVRNAARFGADPARIYLGGHSSGAHMAGVLATTDWTAYGLPADVIKGVLCASGMYDLYPPSLSARSSYVTFDEETLEALSSQRHIDRIRAPFVVAYGTYESPEFQRQGREFAAALEAAGKSVRTLVGTGYNHFEMIETLGNPYGMLGHAALELLDL